MPTQIYKNWLSKMYQCGLTNEQTCGIAILLAWNLTNQKKDSATYDPDIYWQFIEKSDFELISKSAFVIEDFLSFVPLLKLAGNILRTTMPISRFDNENQSTELLNLEWQQDVTNQKEIIDIDDLLYLRHRFDLLWCQKVGESLREEIRNPIHAFVLADYLSHGFIKFDPEGYSRILHSITSRLSPFPKIFSSRYFVIERNGLEGHEPIQIALLGFMNNSELGERLWNLQRVLFYKQPDGIPINLEKQYLPIGEFIEFSLPLITEFIDNNRPSYLNTSKLVATEYLYRNSDDEPFDQFFDILEGRYGFPESGVEEEKPMMLLINAVSFYTVSCLKIRNLTNRISKCPTLKMLDDIGLLWSREILPNQSLRDEAIHCFDVMLSWRFGASWGLFIETEHGFFQRIYVGDTSEYTDVEKLFSEICIAYSPIRCVIAFWSHRQDDAGDVIEEVVFLNLAKDSVSRAEVFQGISDYDFGRGLGKYIGYTEELQMIKGYFSKLQDIFFRTFSSEIIRSKQDELIKLFPTASNWNFVNRLQNLALTDDSVTYVDIENASHDGFKTSLWLLINYINPQTTKENLKFQSSKVFCEYDCKNKTRKFLVIKMFERPMGAGSCVHDSKDLNAPESPIPPEGNIGYSAWEIACTLNPSMNI